MTSNEEKNKYDKKVIILLLILTPIFFLLGAFLIILGGIYLDWSSANIFGGSGLIVLGVIFLICFIISIYLPIKRSKELKNKSINEEIKSENEES